MFFGMSVLDLLAFHGSIFRGSLRKDQLEPKKRGVLPFTSQRMLQYSFGSLISFGILVDIMFLRYSEITMYFYSMLSSLPDIGGEMTPALKGLRLRKRPLIIAQ